MDARRNGTYAPKEPEHVQPNEPLPGPPDGIEIEPARPRPASDSAVRDAARIHEHNRRLARGDVTATEESERRYGVGRTISSVPENGITRGDYSND